MNIRERSINMCITKEDIHRSALSKADIEDVAERIEEEYNCVTFVREYSRGDFDIMVIPKKSVDTEWLRGELEEVRNSILDVKDYVYVLEAECPDCKEIIVLAKRSDKIPLDQDIDYDCDYCPNCGSSEYYLPDYVVTDFETKIVKPEE